MCIYSDFLNAGASHPRVVKARAALPSESGTIRWTTSSWLILCMFVDETARLGLQVLPHIDGVEVYPLVRCRSNLRQTCGGLHVLTITLSRELVGSGRVLFPGTGQLNNQGTNVSAAGLALRPGQVPLKLSQVHNLRGSVPTHWHIFGGPLRQWGVFGWQIFRARASVSSA